MTATTFNERFALTENFFINEKNCDNQKIITAEFLRFT
jgi:hypothetical protein